MSRLSLNRGLTSAEIALAWLALGVIAALAFTPHVRHGGFYLDDWANAAGALYPPGGPSFSNALDYFADLTIYRPVLVLYVPLTYFVFGMHMDLHLIWAVFLALCVAALLYGILRTLGVPWIHAWLISALTLVYPWFDSTRLWATASQISLSVALMLAGVWLALTGLSKRSWRWHAVAAVFYLLSILTYEVTLPLIAAMGLLYVLVAGWRSARARWAVDLAVVAAGGLWVGTHTVREASSLGENFDHLGMIVEGAGTLLGRTIWPVGSQHTALALSAFAAILLVGLAARLRFPQRFTGSRGWGLSGWLALTVGGLLVADLGWFMFIPADPYYTPSVYGMTNRINGLAGLGLVMATYGSFGLLGALVGQLGARRAAIGVAVSVALGVFLAAAYVDVLRRHSTIWDGAYVAERRGLDELRSKFKTLPDNTVVFVAGYPAHQTVGVPIFAATWDLDGMIKVEYENRTLWAYPVLEGLRVTCRPDGVRLVGLGAPETTTRYGDALLVNLDTEESTRPRDREACSAAAANYPSGPLYLSVTY